MAVVIDQDLKYSGSDLVSVFNPNVLLFHSNTSSAETKATAEVDLKISSTFPNPDVTYTFDAVMLEKIGSLFYFRLEITDILPSLIEKLTLPDNEIVGSNNSSMEAYPFNQMIRIINVTIRIQIPSLALETSTPYDIIGCRSVNRIGDTGGSNLYNIWNLATIPTYHIWDGMNSQFAIYIRDQDFITNVSFSSTIDAISEEDISAGWKAINVNVDIGNETKRSVGMTVNDDGGIRDANIIIHKGCDDGVNVRYLSRDYGVRYWQFNKIVQKSSSYKEIGRVINNIDDMNAETRRENIIGIETVPSINCAYQKATIDEQTLLLDIFQSPQIEMEINGTWIGVFAKGSHTINTKKTVQDFFITFELPQEYTQGL